MKNSCKTEAREDLRSSPLTQREKNLTYRANVQNPDPSHGAV
jgi:hypothetical protein